MPVYQFWEYRVKKEVKRMIRAGMSNEDLELIKMPKEWVETPPSNIEWEHSKEFVLNGVYYDIVRSVEKEGDFYFYCYKDTKETALSIGLDRHTREFIAENPTKKDTKETISSFFSKQYWHAMEKQLLLLNTTVIKWVTVDLSASLIYLSNITPPPELV